MTVRPARFLASLVLIAPALTATTVAGTRSAVADPGSTALARTRVDLTVSGSEWVPLRGLALVGGRTYIVRIDKDGPGCIRADAIKFVRL